MHIMKSSNYTVINMTEKFYSLIVTKLVLRARKKINIKSLNSERLFVALNENTLL